MDYEARVDELLSHVFPKGTVATCDVGGRQVFLLKVVKKVGSNYHQVLCTTDRPNSNPEPDVVRNRKPMVVTVPGDTIVSVSDPKSVTKQSKAKAKAASTPDGGGTRAGGVQRKQAKVKQESSNDAPTS